MLPRVERNGQVQVVREENFDRNDLGIIQQRAIVGKPAIGAVLGSATLRHTGVNIGYSRQISARIAPVGAGVQFRDLPRADESDPNLVHFSPLLWPSTR